MRTQKVLQVTADEEEIVTEMLNHYGFEFRKICELIYIFAIYCKFAIMTISTIGLEICNTR